MRILLLGAAAFQYLFNSWVAIAPVLDSAVRTSLNVFCLPKMLISAEENSQRMLSSQLFSNMELAPLS